MDNQLKQQLLELIEAEKSAFRKVLNEFYAKPNPTEAEFLVVNDLLIASLERIFKAYHAYHGEESLFLKNTMRPLQKALDDAVALKQAAAGVGPLSANEEETVTEIPSDRQVVHIILYQATGHDLKAWERQLKSLNSLLQTRPIYLEESDATKAIRGKMGMNTEAYVSVAVKKDAIITTEAAMRRHDRQGRQLITLSEGAVDEERNILQFVIGGHVYRLIHGRLVPRQGSGRLF